MTVIEWAKEVNAVLLEFEGQITISDIHNLTRKELYYLRRFRQAYHIKQKEEADKAAEAAKHAQEQANIAKKNTVAKRIPPRTPRPSSNYHKPARTNRVKAKPRRR